MRCPSPFGVLAYPPPPAAALVRDERADRRPQQQHAAAPGPGRAPAGGRDTIKPPPGFPQDKPDLIGRIRAVSESTLTLDTPQGPRTVLVTETTRFGQPNGEAISRDDLTRGTVVAVFGEPGPYRHSLVARFVLILPLKPETPPPK